MITLRDIQLAYGDRVLLAGVNGTIGARDRLGLVGPNGAGKSTLLRILNGETAPDAGRIEKARYVSIGYLRQEEVVPAGRSVLAEAESAFEDVAALRERLAAAEARLGQLPADAPEYAETLAIMGELEHRLQDLEPERLRANAEAVLSGLGFAPADFERDCGEFSGGWQMRIALARLLLRQPSLLLLDEPTNHLDLPSQRWLEKFLLHYDGALMLVSHDRAFLDLLCNRTWALRAGELDDYAGNYSFYERESRAREAQRQQAWKNQQRELERAREFIERFRYKASKAKQVQSRIKALEKIEVIELAEEEASVRFRFPPPPRSGQVVLEAEGLVKRYGALTVFDGLDLRFERGEKVAVVGPNGAGKSTLVRMLAGAEAPDAGTVRHGHNVVPAWFAQHQSRELEPSLQVIDVVERAAGTARAGLDVRTLLGAFLFRGDDIFKPVRVLSGGEKNRLALARMLVRPANLLILDEPTNHLDMRSKAVLQEALADYAGTVIIVSHDRAFLDGFVNRVLEVRPGTVSSYPGTVSEYLERMEALEARDGAAAAAMGRQGAGEGAAQDPRERRRRAAELRRRLAPVRRRAAEIEARIETMEAKRAELEAAMADPAFYQRGEATTADLKTYEALKAELEAAYATWSETADELARLEAAAAAS